ncbi:hypothetical protein GC170_09670 [bacterium]|nr:hypothetical protein [bacterium]
MKLLNPAHFPDMLHAAIGQFPVGRNERRKVLGFRKQPKPIIRDIRVSQPETLEPFQTQIQHSLDIAVIERIIMCNDLVNVPDFLELFEIRGTPSPFLIEVHAIIFTDFGEACTEFF